MYKNPGQAQRFFRCMVNQRHYLAAALCALLLWLACGQSRSLPALQLAAAPAPAAPAHAFVRSNTLPGTSERVRAPRLLTLPDGDLAAVWLGEGHGRYQPDQAIWFSRQGDNGWHEAFALTTREAAAGHALAHLSALGPPQVLAHAGRVDLWFTAQGPGFGLNPPPGIYAMTSHDAGQSWSAPRRLPVSLWRQGSHALTAAPHALADGGSLLFLGRDATTHLALRLDAQGRVLSEQTLAPAQPQILAANAALPSHGPHALLALPDGHLLLAGSADPENSQLRLWSSADAGQSWRALRLLASSAPTPDSTHPAFDPALHLGPDGYIHLLYVRGGQTLEHLSFTPAWLAERGRTP